MSVFASRRRPWGWAAAPEPRRHACRSGHPGRADRRRLAAACPACRRPRGPSPRSFKLYTAAVTLLAAGAVAGFAIADGWPVAPDSRFWVLAALVLAGELLPIQMPGRYGCDRVTVSTGMAFAVLLAFGAIPAMAVYAVTSLISDQVDPTTWIKLVRTRRNTCSRWPPRPPCWPPPGRTGGLDPGRPGGDRARLGDLLRRESPTCRPGRRAATKQAPVAYLTQDFFLQLWTAGFQLGLSPLIVLAIDESMWLMAFAAVPLLAIYVGGRHARSTTYQASHDMLTDLPNRWALHQALEAALQLRRADGGALVLMIIDLDDFKTVNDTLGHESGDALLEQLAGRMDGGDAVRRHAGPTRRRRVRRADGQRRRHRPRARDRGAARHGPRPAVSLGAPAHRCDGERGDGGVPRHRPDCGRPVAPRRPRPVQGQGVGVALLALCAAARRTGRRPAGDRERAAPGDPGWRAVCRLPAEGPIDPRWRPRRRGLGALAPSQLSGSSDPTPSSRSPSRPG